MQGASAEKDLLQFQNESIQNETRKNLLHDVQLPLGVFSGQLVRSWKKTSLKARTVIKNY